MTNIEDAKQKVEQAEILLRAAKEQLDEALQPVHPTLARAKQIISHYDWYSPISIRFGDQYNRKKGDYNQITITFAGTGIINWNGVAHDFNNLGYHLHHIGYNEKSLIDIVVLHRNEPI